MKHMQSSIEPKLVLDLTGVISIDSLAIRLLINLKKRLEESSKTLFFYNPSSVVMEVLVSVNLDKVFTIIENLDSINRDVAATTYERYLPYTTKMDAVNKVACTCEVCGSSNTSGYLIDNFAYDWGWLGDEPFPVAFTKGTKETFDVLSIVPIVCNDCYMASCNIAHFKVRVGEKVRIPSILDEQSKNILSKGIKKRKKKIEDLGELPPNFFDYPRDKTAACMAYELAENCARSMAVDKAAATPFEIGYLNYISIKYAKNEQKEELINNCRTWLTQVLSEKERYNCFDLARTYFVLVNASLNLGKVKEAAESHAAFTTMINEIKIGAQGIEDPHFWYKQADLIWKREIEDRSGGLKI